MEEEEKKVIFDLYNHYKQTYACYAEIVPLSQVKYKLVSRHEGGKIENGYKEQGLTPIFLSSPQKNFVIISLMEQNISHYDFIEDITVHGEWKHRWNQGIIFAKKIWEQKTDFYIPTRGEEAKKLVKRLIKNI